MNQKPTAGLRIVPRLLTYSIRRALDVSLPYDVLMIEQHANYDQMEWLAGIRIHLKKMTPKQWAILRESNEWVWRMLRNEVVLG